MNNKPRKSSAKAPVKALDLRAIHLMGVRQNNLKNINIDIPLGSFSVVCGPSGSGKSSLAFETLYAEGQRRYIESLSNYSKQFLNKAPKPDLDSIDNVPPALALEQKNSVKSSRSSVGTTTELIDYLRVLYEKVGKAYCPNHNITLEKHSPTRATELTLEQFKGDRGYILFPIDLQSRAEVMVSTAPKKRKTKKKAKKKKAKKAAKKTVVKTTSVTADNKDLIAALLKDGLRRIYIPKDDPAKKKTAKKVTKKKAKKKTKKTAKTATEVFFTESLGEIKEINEKTKLPNKLFYVVADRMAFDEAEAARMTDSFSQAYELVLKYNPQLVSAEVKVITTDGKVMLLGEDNSCTICNYKFPDITNALFSFNSPVGACENCRGFGNILTVDPQKVIPNPALSLSQGALKPFAMPSAARDKRVMINYCKKAKIDIHTPWKDLPKKHQEALWQGNEHFFGVEGLFEYLETKKYKMHVRVFLARHKSPTRCPVCKGSRLRQDALQVLINKKNIHQLSSIPIDDLREFIDELKLTDYEYNICKEPLKQLQDRLGFLNQVGVGYLDLDRPTKTLSGGEFQRISLSNQLGVGLSQTLYVLDEPTIGLHPRDNHRLIEVLHQLNDLGNTLVIVEHDQDVIENASHIIEMGPGSGHLGGTVIFDGSKEDFYKSTESVTAPYLTENKILKIQREPRTIDINKYKYTIELEGCKGNNLKNVDIKIPLNRIVTVTGVSGSGKSSLIGDTLYPALARELNVDYKPALEFKSLTGAHHLKNVSLIDQSPIGSTARSNPVTYLKVYDGIRSVMASSNEARAMGYTASSFSLNVDGGRCPVCKGLGVEIIDMMFMDDLEIPCDACDGKKFRPELLEIQYRGKNIHEILSMSVLQAMDFFVSYPNIRRPLSILREVGLDYISLGQSARSLSGGESQRLKIAKEFNQTNQQKTLYILDEPTTGLHFREVELLMKALNRLVDGGASVLLIEHNLDVIRNSDYIIDLGPDAGQGGGKVVATGRPNEIKNFKKSLTGKYI